MHECRIRDLNSLIQGFSMYWYTVYSYLDQMNRVFRVLHEMGSAHAVGMAVGLQTN